MTSLHTCFVIFKQSLHPPANVLLSVLAQSVIAQPQKCSAETTCRKSYVLRQILHVGYHAEAFADAV